MLCRVDGEEIEKRRYCVLSRKNAPNGKKTKCAQGDCIFSFEEMEERKTESVILAEDGEREEEREEIIDPVLEVARQSAESYWGSEDEDVPWYSR